MKSKIYWPLVITPLYSCLFASQEPCTDPVRMVPKQYNISLSHREANGIGYPDGYSSLKAFINPWISSDWMPFIDLRGHVFNDGKFAANGGIGVRTYLPKLASVAGVNLFYDYRHTKHHSNFNQLGVGLDWFWKFLDVSANGYFPVGDRDHSYKKGFQKFSGHRALFYKKTEFDFWGGDLGIGGELFHNQNFNLRTQLVGYHFEGKFGKTATGGLLRFNADLSSFVTLELQGSYDSLFKWIGQAELALNFPFRAKRKNKAGCSYRNSLTGQVDKAVSRFEIIVAKSHKSIASAIDSATGDPLNFIFVDNQRGSSDGSFENPYRTLAQAQANSNPNDVIYVFYGNGTSQGMDQGIQLKVAQQFIGSSYALKVATPFGRLPIPKQTTLSPFIENINMNMPVVTLADSNTVAGFNINGPTFGYGIRGDSFVNAKIRQNFITSSPSSNGAIFLQGLNGLIDLADNQVTADNGILIFLLSGGTSNVSLTGNSISLPGANREGIFYNAVSDHQGVLNALNNILDQTVIGVSITTNTDVDLQVNLFNNLFTGNAIGISLNSKGASTIQAVVGGNTIKDSQFNGISVLSEGTSHLAFKGQNNQNTGSDSLGFLRPGFSLESQNTSTLTAQVLVNRSVTATTAPGYKFTNSGATFFAESSNQALSGIENSNSGTFETSGTITFIPLN